MVKKTAFEALTIYDIEGISCKDFFEQRTVL